MKHRCGSARDAAIEGLCAAQVVTLGLDLTDGRPPLIVEAAACVVSGGCVTGGPLSFPVAVDVPYRQIPRRCWPGLYQAPTWSRTALRLIELLADRVLVMRDRDRFDVLCRHLPDWRPVAVLFACDLAGRAARPRAAASGSAWTVRSGGAVVEAHLIALLLGELVDRWHRSLAR